MLAPETVAKLQQVRLFISDVDGTLTDGALYYADAGQSWRRFHVHDGLGIRLLRQVGIHVALVSQESTVSVEERARKLGVEYCLGGIREKKRAVLELAEHMGLPLNCVAYIGDDLTDLEAIRIAGVSACPADAVPEVRRAVDYVCARPGGYGAVREFCMLILYSQNITLEEMIAQSVGQFLEKP